MNFSLFKSLLFLFLGLGISNVYAQLSQSEVPSWVITPDSKPIVPDLEDISDGYYFESCEYQVNVQSTTRFYRDVKVVFDNAGTESAGQININFNPEYQKVIFHELAVIRNGNRINKLDIKQVKQLSLEDDLTRSIYNGMKSAYFIIDDLRKDDKIISSYSIQGFNSVFQNKFSDSYYLQSYEPIGRVYARYIIPNHRTVKFKTYRNAPNPVVTDIGSDKVYTWDVTGTEKASYSFNTPSWYTNVDYIECSEYTNWQEVSDWIANINPILPINPNSSLGKYVDKLWKEAKGNTNAFLDAATKFVQNDIRYMGVEVGEYSHRANNPEKVFQQRYGDCKDKSVLLASMLQSKGIQAYLVLANTTVDTGLGDRLPSPLHFNHMIVETNIDGRSQIIDPTISNQGGGIKDRYLPYYGQVLSTSRPKELLGLSKVANRKIKIVETYKMEAGYKAQLLVETIYEGGSADEIRNYFKSTAKNQIQKSYLDYYTRLYPKTEKKENLRFEDNVAHNVFKVFESYSISELGTLDKDSGKRILPLYGNQVNNYIPEIEGSHLGPISLSYPMDINHVIKIVNADGSSLDFPVDNMFKERTAYSYGKHVMTNQDTLNIAYQFSIHSSYIDEKDVDAFKQDFVDRDDYLYNAFFIAENGTLEGADFFGSPSWLSYLIVILTIIITLTFIIKYYHRTSPKYLVFPQRIEYDARMNGWTVFLGFSLVASTIKLLYFFFSDHSLLVESVWIAHKYLNINGLYYTGLIVFEIFANTVLVILFIYTLVLYFNKRDIFPQTVLFVLILNLSFILLDTTFAYLLMPTQVSAQEVIPDILRNLIFTFVWGSYVLKSENIKNVFVNTYSGENKEIRDMNNIEWENISDIK